MKRIGYLLALVFALGMLALPLLGCRTAPVLLDEIGGILPATQGDLDDLREHVDSQDAAARSDADAAIAKTREDAIATDRIARSAVEAAVKAGQDAATAVLSGYDASIAGAIQTAEDAKVIAGQKSDESVKRADEAKAATSGLASSLVALIDALTTTGLVGGPILAGLLALRSWMTRKKIKKAVKTQDDAPFIGPGGIPLEESKLVEAALRVMGGGSAPTHATPTAA